MTGVTTVADEAVAARMFDARQALETRERGRLTLEELGRRIGAADESREEGKPYLPGVVKRWLEGDAEPEKIATWRAIAKVFGVRMGWLANGELPISDEQGEQGAKPVDATPPTPAPTKRARPPLQEPEILETRWIRSTGKKKATPKRRPGDRSAVA